MDVGTHERPHVSKRQPACPKAESFVNPERIFADTVKSYRRRHSKHCHHEQQLQSGEVLRNAYPPGHCELSSTQEPMLRLVDRSSAAMLCRIEQSAGDSSVN